MGLLAQVISHHQEKLNERHQKTVINKNIEKFFHVDDLLKGANTTEDAINIFKRYKEVFFNTKMNLLKWKNNSKQVNKYVETYLNVNLSHLTYASLMLNPGEGSEDQILGVTQDTDSDKLIISLRLSEEDERIASKRELLKRIASIYNSLRILSPIGVTLKKVNF